MREFVQKHQDKISGVISCFDRVVFKGYLPLGWPGAMERLLQKNGLLIKDFKGFVSQNSERIKQAARALAEETGCPYERVTSKVRKEKLARKLAKQNNKTEGLACILSAVEGCQSFKVVPGTDRPRIINAQRKCLCLYFYYLDPLFGMLHVRLPTWFPFTIQVALNGHDFLAARMSQEAIKFEKLDNAFVYIADCDQAQNLANSFWRQPWPEILYTYAKRVNPLLADLLKGMPYYWVTEQAEFATDIIFRDQAALEPLYENVVKHAITCFSAEDVMTFLGRKLHGGFAGEIVSHYKKRWPGVRVKHRMKENWIKMYDKHGAVLRIETVINRPYEFKVRRRGKRKGQLVTDWFPMAKGVSNLYRYAEVSLAVNTRYLQALSAVPDPDEARQVLRTVGQRVTVNGCSYRAFNPLDVQDARLFAATLRGEHAIRGFQNRDIRERLFPKPTTVREARAQSARTWRLLKRLHVRALVARIPRTRKWKVTLKGQQLMSAFTIVHMHEYPELLAA